MQFRRELAEQIKRLRHTFRGPAVPETPAFDVSRVTRLEVVDEIGRAYVTTAMRVDLSLQDAGRTLKVLVAK